MGVMDLREIAPINDSPVAIASGWEIPEPDNEPVVGVIDTPFDSNAYFNKWVESKDMLPPEIQIHPRDRQHGTAVSSIIVDGPRGNPALDDGCGRFRVRHFGVSTATQFSAFEIIKTIRTIVSENRDIKVWNFSLGSTAEVRPNFISPEGAELDRLQREFDVLFVVAGTNLPLHPEKIPMRLGAPADSLNSVVVNSVGFDNAPASYARTGPVLSFFNKPNVSYYGGDGEREADCIVVNEGEQGDRYRFGTSFAAPWITRKLAYLICKLGFSREVAKALLVDSAAGWGIQKDKAKIGYGVVPRHNSQIVGTPGNEIRFILSGCQKNTRHIPILFLFQQSVIRILFLRGPRSSIFRGATETKGSTTPGPNWMSISAEFSGKTESRPSRPLTTTRRGNRRTAAFGKRMPARSFANGTTQNILRNNPLQVRGRARPTTPTCGGSASSPRHAIQPGPGTVLPLVLS